MTNPTPPTAAEPYAILVLRNAIDRRRPTTVRWSDDANAYALCDLRTDTLTPLSDVLTAYDALRAELAQARAEVDSVQAIIDLMRDEFKRIKALCINEPALMGEIIGLCERAVTNIHQHVPVVVQRDDAERARNEARRERDNAVERLAAFRRHVEGAPTLASIVEQANGFRMLDFVRFVDGDDYTVTELIARPTLAPEPAK